MFPHKAQQGSVRRRLVDTEPLTIFSICPQSPLRWTQWWNRCPGCWAPGCQTRRELGPSQHFSPSSTWRRCTSPMWASPCLTSRKCAWVSGRMPGGKGMSHRGSLQLKHVVGQRQDILAPCMWWCWAGKMSGVLPQTQNKCWCLTKPFTQYYWKGESLTFF